MIEHIDEEEPLSMDQIEMLSPHSSQCVIPYNQQRFKRYGLILFSSAGRPGASEEADDLTKALEATGFDVIKTEWSEAGELQRIIDSAMESMVDDCSLMLVCLMSHGSRGSLRSLDREEVPVNNILHQLSYHLPKSVPMVCMTMFNMSDVS